MTLFLEFWKRYQAELEYEWDTVEFLAQEEPSRPEYEAKCIYERKNPVTGVNHTHFPANVTQLTLNMMTDSLKPPDIHFCEIHFQFLSLFLLR